RRVKPGCASISRAQRTAYVISRLAVPSCDHVLIRAILDNFKISHPLKCARCALEDLRPRHAGVSAAPDCTLETCHSEIGAAEQNQVGIVVTKTHGVEIRFVQRALVRTKWSPGPVVLATVQALLGHTRWTTGDGIERAVRSKSDCAVSGW